MSCFRQDEGVHGGRKEGEGGDFQEVWTENEKVEKEELGFLNSSEQVPVPVECRG